MDTEKIVLTFTMPPDYKGTPAITLIAPGRASTINDLPLNIKGIPNMKLEDFPIKMFGQTPDPDPFRIDRVKVFRASATSLTALVSGAGFGIIPTRLQVFVNGQKIDPASPPRLELPSDKLMRLTFDVPEDPSIRVTIVSEDADAKKRKTIESDPVANPSFLSVSDVDVLVYEAATEEEPAMVVVKITGTGFTDDLTTSVGEIAVKSATEAILTIPNPKAAAVVTLTDQVTHKSVKVVVTRKSKPPGRP